MNIKDIFKKLRKKTADIKSERADSSHYFHMARSWADDMYLSAMVSRHRYQAAFFVVVIYAMLLSIALCIAIVREHVSMVVVHQNPSGFSYVTMEEKAQKMKISRAQIESELVRYVTARESYHPATYRVQSELVSILSAPSVKARYQLSQSSSHKNAAVHALKNKGYRKVSVNSLVFLDEVNKKDEKSKHVNLAQVHFTMSDYRFSSDRCKDKVYVALISWRHLGVPKNPERMWKNWDGFEVTSYQAHSVS